nr:hypothetical protein [uncultured Anaeromusa sp.]
MQSKTQLCHRLATARQWLHQAEESFGKKQEMQGELNLFLAQAELQHVRESRKLPFWLQSCWGWQGMAMAFAVLLVLSAGAGIFWAEQNAAVSAGAATKNQVLSTNTNSEKAPATEQQVVFNGAKQQQTDTAPAVLAKPKAAAIIPEEKQTEETSKSAKAEAVSPEEMQKALRAAGKALRGAGQ